MDVVPIEGISFFIDLIVVIYTLRTVEEKDNKKETIVYDVVYKVAIGIGRTIVTKDVAVVIVVIAVVVVYENGMKNTVRVEIEVENIEVI